MTVGEMCTQAVIIARPEWSVIEAAQCMAEYDVGALVVVEEEDGEMFPIGLVTDRDLVVDVLAKEINPWSEMTVESIMTCELVSAHSEEDLSAAINRMQREEVRRLPVVNDEGILQGILSYDDIVEWLSEQMLSLALVARAARSSADSVLSPV